MIAIPRDFPSRRVLQPRKRLSRPRLLLPGVDRRFDPAERILLSPSTLRPPFEPCCCNECGCRACMRFGGRMPDFINVTIGGFANGSGTSENCDDCEAFNVTFECEQVEDCFYQSPSIEVNCTPFATGCAEGHTFYYHCRIAYVVLPGIPQTAYIDVCLFLEAYSHTGCASAGDCNHHFFFDRAVAGDFNQEMIDHQAGGFPLSPCTVPLHVFEECDPDYTCFPTMPLPIRSDTGASLPLCCTNGALDDCYCRVTQYDLSDPMNPVLESYATATLEYVWN
jgi:hypothetical protein